MKLFLIEDIILAFISGLICGLVIGFLSKVDLPSPIRSQTHVLASEGHLTMLSALNSPILVEEYLPGVTIWEDTPYPHYAYAVVTGYNTIPEQTDNTPCISASGDNICGRDRVVACPRSIPLGSWIGIDGKSYQCLDRLAQKYDDRFDISFDKDIEAAQAWGLQVKEITTWE